MTTHIGARQCFFCGVSTVRGPRRRSQRPIQSYLITEDYIADHPYIIEYACHLFDDRQITVQDRICRPCLQRADRFVTTQIRAQEEEEAALASQRAATDDVLEPPSSQSSELQSDPLRVTPQEQVEDIPLEVDNIAPEQAEEMPQMPNVPLISVPGFSRIPFSSTNCIMAGCSHRDNLHRINLVLRTNILSKQNIYIQHGVRVCEEHSRDGALWLDLAVHGRPTIDTFNSTQIANMLKMLQKKNSKYLNFDRLETIDDTIFNYYIGFTKENFLTILEETPSLTEAFKKPKIALAMVMCKLHTGDSNERLANVFHVSPQYLSRIMKKTRNCLMHEFVTKHLGFDHIYGPGFAFSYRDQLRERILRIPHILFAEPNCDQLISICDGTYFYMQKSSNYRFQRLSYSSHKYRNLLKMFLIVSPDGYIIEAFGPYAATKSDATIMEELISENEDNPFHWFFKNKDIFILDRGFRDVVEKMNEFGYKTYLPLTKDDDKRQLTTQQANESRKVTLCRWVVETINGRLKNQFRQLRSQYVNIAAPHLKQVIKFACALLNAFGKRLVDHRLADQIINEIYLKYDAPNRLSELVIQNNFNQRRAAFQAIDASHGFEHFPNLSYDDLLIMSLGPYQVEQARSYYGEHVKEDGTFFIEVYEDLETDYNLTRFDIVALNPWLARAKIHSRHQTTRMYFVYILLDNSLKGRNKIIGHYCNCLVGMRTLGCCAHVMCIIWYMAWARHQETPIRPPAEFLDYVIRQDVDDDD